MRLLTPLHQKVSPPKSLEQITCKMGTNGDPSYTISSLNSGMTSAISTAPPKPLDLKLTKELEELLKSHGIFETTAEMTHRMEILSKLDLLVKNWVRDLSIQKNMPPSVAELVMCI